MSCGATYCEGKRSSCTIFPAGTPGGGASAAGMAKLVAARPSNSTASRKLKSRVAVCMVFPSSRLWPAFGSGAGGLHGLVGMMYRQRRVHFGEQRAVAGQHDPAVLDAPAR